MKIIFTKRTLPRSIPIEVYLFVAVFALRVISLTKLAGSEFFLPASGDMHFYNQWALRILQGQWTDHHAFYGLPLYAYLLAGLYLLCGYSPFVPGLLQAGLDGGTAVLLYKIAIVLFERADKTGAKVTCIAEGIHARIIGIISAIGWALFQPAQAYAIILMPTSWLVFVFWFVVWQIVRRKDAPPHWILFGLGLLIGFSAMGIATILFLVPLLLAAIVAKWPVCKSRRVVGAILVLSGLMLGASPAWIHNYLIAEDRVFLSAHGGVNFWIGNNPTATGYPKFPPGLRADQQAMLQDSIKLAERAEGRSLKRSEVSAYWSSQAVAWIKSHPGAWLQLLALKVKNFWNAFQYDDLSVVSGLREGSIIIPGESFGFVAALGIAGMFVACRRWPDARWIAAAVLLQMASLLTVFVTERYRLAAVPGLLLFGAYGIVELWRRIEMRRYQGALVFVAILVGSTLFISMPQRDPTLWALDSYNSGIRALDAGRLTLAQDKFERAYAYSPNNAELNFALGNLCLAKGKSDRAKKFYSATLSLNPTHERALNNLGVVALNEGHWRLAGDFFSRALQQSPEDAKVHYLLASAEFASGDFLAASNAISTARKLDPERPEFAALQDRIAQAETDRSLSPLSARRALPTGRGP
ncbi:MAG TPA: tetratricopeptide repeat protein [Chthoniobacterales bacterium]|nr:tetratricopeptide repeat protein [Chthoniobacterales bacterium]